MKVLALLASGAAVLPSVLGHGYIVDPAAQWEAGYAENGFGSTIDSNMFGAIDNSKYGYGTDGTVAFFEAEFNSSGYDSLGQFIITNQVLYSSSVDAECGMTVYKDSARSALPATNLTYSGFTHPGPCEVWCDDTKLLFDYNCQATYSDIPAGVPYDESKCTGANRLTVYWLALHAAPWQAYIDCVWLEDGSGSGSAPSPVTETVGSSVATAPPTASSSGSTNTATTAYPSTSGSTTSSTTASTSTTTTTTTAPTATTATPTATSSSTTATTTSSASSEDDTAAEAGSEDEASDETSADDDTANEASDETDTSSASTSTATTTATTTTTDAPATTTEAPTATTATTTTTTTASTSEKCNASTRRRRRN